MLRRRYVHPSTQHVNNFILYLFLLKNPPESSRSRPQTPSISSRPQTPSLPLSRPQTPLSLSRPTTPCLSSHPSAPAHPVQRHGTPVSRPNTPQSPTRPTTPLPVKMPSQLYHDKDDDVKSAFLVKQKQFQRMKKELDMKQVIFTNQVSSLLGCFLDQVSTRGFSCVIPE